MLREEFTIFVGPSGHGKTTFLHRLAFELKARLGSRIAFISPEYEQQEDAYFMSRRYDMVRYLSAFKESSEYNNKKVIESISELCSSGKIDLVFVDDIEAFSDSIFGAIKLIPAKKAFTCSYFPFIDENYEYTIDGFENYFLKCEYNGNGISGNPQPIPTWKFSIESVDGIREEWNSFISSSIRNQKINSIIR